MKKKYAVLAPAVLLLAAVCLPLFGGGVELPAFFVLKQEPEPAQRLLIPGGSAVGVALRTRGVMVVSKGSRAGRHMPLQAGDVILTVGDTPVDSAAALSEQIGMLDGERATLGVLRGGRRIEVEAAAPIDAADGKRRLGVWVRDSTAGVGTLTYIDPQTGGYGALGHAIVDADTGSLLEVADGAVLTADVVGVKRGECGAAGELRGSFLKENRQIGTLLANTGRGVFGVMEEWPDDLLYPQGLPAAGAGEAHAGQATIISTVDGEGAKEYAVEILRFTPQNLKNGKDMLLRVTDERLLAVTGGIVQGMSGSPIIQDGKLVGAVTHVLVDDPTRGYGIFIENMLEAAS